MDSGSSIGPLISSDAVAYTVDSGTSFPTASKFTASKSRSGFGPRTTSNPSASKFGSDATIIASTKPLDVVSNGGQDLSSDSVFPDGDGDTKRKVCTTGQCEFYEGGVKDGKPHGRGKTFYKEGKVQYDGDWVHGRLTGQCRVYNKHDMLVFEGECRKERPHGQGTMYFTDGTKYSGSWDNGAADGEGTLFYANGNPHYDGSWRQGKFHGSGKMFFPEGKLTYYDGQWDNDLMHGGGMIYYHNGHLRYDGYLSRGKFQGSGKLYDDKGILAFDCKRWEEGKMNGEVMEYDKQGKFVKQRLWHNGKPALR